MKEYIKYFRSNQQTNGYEIIYIPFISTIKENNTLTNIRCWIKGMEIEVTNNVPHLAVMPMCCVGESSLL